MSESLWPIEKVIPYPANPREITDRAVATVAGSIQEYGFQNPILVNEEGVVLAGHTRLEAARALGLEEVPVKVVEGLTEAQQQGFRIMDNRAGEFAEWDVDLLKLQFQDLADFGFDLDLTGFESYEIARLDGAKAPDSGKETDPDEEWDGMPDFESEDKTSFRKLVVHFASQDDVDAFEELVGPHLRGPQRIGEKTRFIWFPELVIESHADKVYDDEPEDGDA